TSAVPRSLGRRRRRGTTLWGAVSRTGESRSAAVPPGDKPFALAGGPERSCSLTTCSLRTTREVLAVARTRHADRSSELQLCQTVAVGAGDVLVVCGRERLLGLDDFNAVRHARGKPFLRAPEVLVGKVDVLARDADLFLRRLQIQQ